MAIDFDRGVIQFSHSVHGVGDIFMYVDEPGTYFNVKEKVVSDEDAERAGIPVRVHKALQKRKELLKAAADKIDAEYKRLLGKIDDGEEEVFELGQKPEEIEKGMEKGAKK